ncbi:Polyphosphate:AMP/ADP phosphotransferase [Methylocella tundrae]|uniref:Polyphosphate:AMP/ADP phosphotransferase n=1 Tax=Methylocella tundrae TaxID=227605 RepID=A0A8B6M3R2_METTU|nr:PPK2 family polyphosphate kinase [Methylocella tundrae]VTZ27299.1 Polyphosphate:AMP/ADP phosphotransferase [Methylocella tundrae]VTZ48920.1 Polyphosphate:AMP/ADP phosphotransferase [Methylocella tundrae]
MDYRKTFFVEPDRKLKLNDLDPASTPGVESKQQAADVLEAARQRLAHQQNLLYAEKKHSLLIVLQGTDAAGKDGVIARAFASFNAQGVAVANFKEPTSVELAHDFLWRVHPHAPTKGWVAIFNRSHYEDVLITRVHKLIDEKTVIDRIARIRDFETLLAENGATILKFFLHISKEEQLARFEKRLLDPERNWKISEADYAELPFWDDYVKATEEALNATSTMRAPWYVIPSNHKWFRDVAISTIVADALEDLGMRFPKPSVDLDDIRRKYHAALLAEKAGK